MCASWEGLGCVYYHVVSIVETGVGLQRGGGGGGGRGGRGQQRYSCYSLHVMLTLEVRARLNQDNRTRVPSQYKHMHRLK